jgi:hypothetical protein
VISKSISSVEILVNPTDAETILIAVEVMAKLSEIDFFGTSQFAKSKKREKSFLGFMKDLA